MALVQLAGRVRPRAENVPTRFLFQQVEEHVERVGIHDHLGKRFNNMMYVEYDLITSSPRSHPR
jgi:hypothetical protein